MSPTSSRPTVPTPVWLTASLIAYLACLPLDTFCVGGDCSGWPGIGVLIMGWLEVMLFPQAGLAWLANPAIYLAWFFTARKARRAALKAAGVATLLAASFMLAGEVLVSTQGTPSRVHGYGAGYWLWLASMVLALAAAYSLPSRSAAAKSAAAPAPAQASSGNSTSV